MKALIANMIGASRLDVNTYEHVEADAHTTGGALAVVLISSFAAALGAGMTTVSDIAGLVVVALLSWLIWVALTDVIGTTILSTPATHSNFGELFRTTGYSAAPGILRIFGAVPVIGWWIFLGATIWMLFAFVVAVRQALDFTSTGRALLVCSLGWLIHGAVLFAFVMRAW